MNVEYELKIGLKVEIVSVHLFSRYMTYSTQLYGVIEGLTTVQYTMCKATLEL